MINMLSNKQVYEKSEVDGAIAQVNNSIANTSRVLEDKIKESVSALFEYKGPCRYMGSYSAGKYPPYEQCHRNDIIRWTNNKVLQCELTGTHQFKELTDIRAGWVFNLTESCVTDACWVDEYGVTIAENTSIAVVDLLTTGPGLVDGCQWGFDAFADSASSGFHVDDEMSPTSVNPVQNKVITAALNNVGGFIIVDELPEVEYANPRKTYYIDSGNTTAGDSPVALYDGYVVVDGAWCKVATSSFDTIVVDAINLGTTSIKSISTEYYQHATVILDGDGIISFNKGKIKVKIAQTAISSSNYPYYTIEWIDADLTSVGVYTPNYNTLYWEYQHDITPEQKIALHFNGYSPDDKLYIDYTEGDVYFSVVEEHYPITTGTQIQHGVTGVQEPIHVDYSNVSGTPDMSNYVETVEKGASNGVATLDATGRVPYTQLPESAMEFKGGWDASTNNPELKDGTGVNGDFYVCSVAGTVNFGTAGSPRNVTFYANDRALYDGTRHQWIRLPASEVRSVNGMSGDVELDIPAAQVNSDWNATTGKAQILNKPSLATVATSGSYTDLSNTPSIPAAQVNSDWNASSGVAQILNKPSLATVATSGSYNDLSNTPSIPAAQVNSDWNATSGKAEILNKPTLATVATSGSYNDLSNRPSVMIGATSSVSGASGFVPVPTAGANTKFLRGDGTWQTVATTQEQANWNETNQNSPAFIKNKPSILTVQDVQNEIDAYYVGTVSPSRVEVLTSGWTVFNDNLIINTNSTTTTNTPANMSSLTPPTLQVRYYYTKDGVTTYQDFTVTSRLPLVEDLARLTYAERATLGESWINEKDPNNAYYNVAANGLIQLGGSGTKKVYWVFKAPIVTSVSAIKTCFIFKRSISTYSGTYKFYYLSNNKIFALADNFISDSKTWDEAMTLANRPATIVGEIYYADGHHEGVLLNQQLADYDSCLELLSVASRQRTAWLNKEYDSTNAYFMRSSNSIGYTTKTTQFAVYASFIVDLS